MHQNDIVVTYASHDPVIGIILIKVYFQPIAKFMKQRKDKLIIPIVAILKVFPN